MELLPRHYAGIRSWILSIGSHNMLLLKEDLFKLRQLVNEACETVTPPPAETKVIEHRYNYQDHIPNTAQLRALDVCESIVTPYLQPRDRMNVAANASRLQKKEHIFFTSKNDKETNFFRITRLR